MRKKAVVRKEGTIYGACCYVRADEEEVSLGTRRDAFVFDWYIDAGRWVDDHEGDFVIEPARTA